MGGLNWSRMQEAAEGDLARVVATYQDDEIVAWGDDRDIIARWDGSIFEFLPVTDDTGTFTIGDGTYDMDFQVFMDSTAAYVLIDQSEQLMSIVGGYLAIGLTGTPTSVVMDGTKALSVYTTSASASATSLEPVVFSNTLTGVGQTGGRTLCYMTTDVALGQWSNALKALVEYGSSGRTDGMGSALCAELILSAGTTQGTYAPLEAELVGAASCKTGTASAFLFCNIDGATGSEITTINENGYFFIIGDGIADTTDGMFETEAISAVDATHVLRVLIKGTEYWLALHTSKGMA